MSNNENVWEMTLARLDQTMSVLDLKPGVVKYLRAYLFNTWWSRIRTFCKNGFYH